MAIVAIVYPACASDSSSPSQAIDADPIDREQYADAIAQTWCEAREGCGCPFEPNLDACIYEIGQEQETLAQMLVAEGLAYDATCAGEQAQGIEAHACDWLLELHEGADPCPAFHGDKPLGVGCTKVGPQARFSDCDRGLYCYAPTLGVPSGTCVKATPPIRAAGESCIDEDAAASAPALPCAEGLYCTDGVCAPIVAEGGSCDRPDACGDAAHCDGLRASIDEPFEAGICQPLPTAGESCITVGDCFDAVCSEGMCVGLGDPCGGYVEGFSCEDDGTLGPAPAVCTSLEAQALYP